MNGEDSPTKSYKNPPRGYPIKTPVAIPPSTTPIIPDLSSSFSYRFAIIPIPATAILEDAIPCKLLANSNHGKEVTMEKTEKEKIYRFSFQLIQGSKISY